MKRDWDWKRMIPSWDWHKLVLAGWPGWMLSDKDEPNFVTFEIVNGQGKSSREMAIEWDDLAEGQFYYRDYTRRSIPFIGADEMYKAIFCFQYERDAVEFNKRFEGGLNQELAPFEERIRIK